MKEDYTTDGWFVKNGGVTELPGAIRDRLFNIKVANDLDSGNLVNENSETMMGEYQYVYEKDADGNLVKKSPAEKVTRLPYVRQIYGKNVVLPSKSLSYEKDKLNYVYHDTEGKAFYICEVYEAPSTAKITTNSSSVYKNAEGKVDEAKIENFSRQIAKILGTKDSYIKDAYTQYLNKYKFTFNDTALYEHFKSEYPDLDQFQD